MADRAVATSATKPIWMKQAEEAKIKSEAEKTAAAKAALEATFKALEASKAAASTASAAEADASSDDDDDRDSDLSRKPAGPIDPSKCLAAGAGISGGTAGAPSTFTVVAKDSDGRRISIGGADVKVKISPGVGVGGSDVEGIVKDQNDGSYAVTYAVSKRGNYMVHVECNGRPIMGSPFPVFFSAGAAVGSTVVTPTVSPYPSMVNQTMPNMPNYSGSVSGAFPGFMGMVPGMVQGSSGGVLMPGMTGGMSTMGTLSQQPMAPSAAAMAAAQAIVAARQAAQMQAQQSAAGDSGSLDPAVKADVLKRTLQVSNLSPLLTAEHLKQLFAYCGTVVDCSITDSKHFAYIEFSKPEEATAALALNNMDVGGRPLNVEIAKSLPSKSALPNNSLPLALQQAVALQQMQFQQALLMQQTMASQQAASRAATMKSATDMAAARALEISKKLKAEGLVGDDNDMKEANRKSRSPSPSRRKSKSRSRSPIKHWRSRRSRSISPSIRFARHRRSRSPIRYHHSSRGSERRSYKDDRDIYSRGGRREMERSRDHYSSSSRRNMSRSASPRARKPERTGSISPKNRRESSSPRTKRSSRASSRSPAKHHEGNKSPTREHRNGTSHRSRHSRSRSPDRKHHTSSKEYAKDYEKSERKHHTSSKEYAKDSEKSERKHHYSSKGHEKESDKASAERKHHSRSKEDGKISEKTSKDVKDSEKTKDESRRSDRIDAAKNLRGSRGLADDRNLDLSVIDHKRSSLPEDGNTNHERESNHHKRSKLDDQNTKGSDTVGNDQNGTREDLESIEEKRSVHKRRSTCNDDDIENRESGRHEKSSSSYKKHERTDSGTKERDSSAYESSRYRDDRRSSRHSSSISHRSSGHTEKRSSRDSKSHRKEEKLEEDYEKSHRADTIVKESRSSDKRHDRLEAFSKMKTDRSRSYSPEDEVRGGLKGSREHTENYPEKVDPLAVKPDTGCSSLEGEKQDSRFDHNLKRSPKLQEHEISFSTEKHGLRKASELKMQNGENSNLFAHKDYNVQHALNPEDGTIKNMEGPTPNGLADEVPKMEAVDPNMEIVSRQDQDFGHGNSLATHSPAFDA